MDQPAGIRYRQEPDLTAEEFYDVLRRSTLLERRDVPFPETFAAMLRQADLVLTARTESGLLVGIARALSDFSYCTYLADLAVDQDFQRRGIGQELLRRTHEAAGLHTSLILLAAPAARDYYPKLGMTRHDSCWIIPRQSS